MIPASEIITRVRTQYEAESSVRWSTVDVLDAINDGIDDLSEVTRFYERHVSIPIETRTYFDTRGFLPESAIGVTSVWNTTLNDWLDPIHDLKLRPRWEQARGTPRQFFMRGLFWMAVFPRPETTTGTFRVYFSGFAPHLTHSQAVIRDLLPQFVPAIEEYALYELSAQDGESSRALLHWGEYNRRSKQIADFVNRRIVTARTLKMGVR